MGRLGGSVVVLLVAGCGGIVEERASERAPPSPETQRACAAPASLVILGTGSSAAASSSGCTVAIISSDERSMRIHDPTGKTQSTFVEDGRISFIGRTPFVSGRLLYLVARDGSNVDLVARDDEGLGARHVLAQKIGNASVTSERAAFATAWSDRGVLSIPLTGTRVEPIALSSKAYIAWVGDDAALVVEPSECAAECSAPEMRHRYASECGNLRFARLDGTRNVEVASAARLLSMHPATGRVAFERTLADGRRAIELAFPKEGRPSIELRRFARDSTSASGERVCDGASVNFTPDGRNLVIDADHVVVPSSQSGSSCPGPLRRANADGRKLSLTGLDPVGDERPIAFAPEALVLGVHSGGLMARRDELLFFVHWDGNTEEIGIIHTAARSGDARERYIVQTAPPSSAILLDARNTLDLRIITKRGHVLAAWNDEGAPRWFFTTEAPPICDGGIADWHDLKPAFIDLSAGSERMIEYWPVGMIGREGVLYRVHPSNDEGFVIGPIPR